MGITVAEPSFPEKQLTFIKLVMDETNTVGWEIATLLVAVQLNASVIVTV